MVINTGAHCRQSLIIYIYFTVHPLMTLAMHLESSKNSCTGDCFEAQNKYGTLKHVNWCNLEKNPDKVGFPMKGHIYTRFNLS